MGDTLYLIMRVYFEKPRTTTDASNPPYQRKLAALDDLKKSLLHKVFTGRL